MKTIKELELDLIVKEALIQQLKYKNEMLREEIASVYEDIIDKAIEYIEEKWNNDSYFDDIDNCLKFLDISEYDKEELLDILKGVDKE